MDKAELQDLAKRQRLALCDQLDTLTEPQFEVDSLCDGWRVRDVVGHLVSIVELPVYKFAAFTPAGLDRVFDKRAKEFGVRDPWALVAEYRTRAGKFVPISPAGKYGELCDVATHCLDISRPLDLYSAVIPEAKPVVLDGLVGGSWFAQLGMKLFRGRRFDNRRLVATDVEWSHGDGPEVRGTADDLILGITGRPLDATRLEGEGVAAFLAAS